MNYQDLLEKVWNPDDMTDEEFSFFYNTLINKIQNEKYITTDEIFILTELLSFSSKIQYGEPCGYENLIYCDYVFYLNEEPYIISGTFNEHDGFNFEGQVPRKAEKKMVEKWVPIRKEK